MLTLHDNRESGNGYKVRLLLALLGIPYRLVNWKLGAEGTRTPEFLEKNPNGRIPLLELEDGRHIAESNAILLYLASGSRFLPEDPFELAKVHQWLFFEQYNHEPNIAVARYWAHHADLDDPYMARQMEDRKTRGYDALRVMEERLSSAEWLAGKTPTVADISLSAYTFVADEGGFNLTDYPGVMRWLYRIRELPGFIAMPSYEEIQAATA